MLASLASLQALDNYDWEEERFGALACSYHPLTAANKRDGGEFCRPAWRGGLGPGFNPCVRGKSAKRCQMVSMTKNDVDSNSDSL